jgi:hypothetical protein
MLLSMCAVIKNKNGIQDLEKIIHYCELEIKKMKDISKKK